MADSAAVCLMLQTEQARAMHPGVHQHQTWTQDNRPADLTLPLGAQHSGTNSLVHLPPAQLDAEQAALLDQLPAEWAYFARTGHASAPRTPAWAPYSRRQHPVMLLPPADANVGHAGSVHRGAARLRLGIG